MVQIQPSDGNLRKFQYMLLSKTVVNHSIETLVLLIASSKSVERLRLTIENKLNFDTHINDLWKVASTKLKLLVSIRNISKSRRNMSQ